MSTGDPIAVIFGDEPYDAAMACIRQEGYTVDYSTVTFCIRDSATVGGNPGVLMSFDAFAPGSVTPIRMGFAVTGKMFMMIAAAMKGRYPVLFGGWT